MSRYTFGGDEHVFVEVDEEMSLEAFFTSLAMTNAVREAKIDGVTEICPANASFQIKFDPDKIHPQKLMDMLKEMEASAEKQEAKLNTRIVEVPVYYRDPWTHETLMRFRERHQDPNGTDLEYAAKINGYDSVEAFIEAHHGAPWFVSMVGFVSGLPFLYQMVDRARQIQVPKYLIPRTDTPKQTVGYGGSFSCVYSVRGAGGYQMFGITPMTIFDPLQKTPYLKDFMVFFKPGDIVKWRPIDRDEYESIAADVQAGRFEPRTADVVFSLDDFNADMDGTNAKLMEALYAD
ncbi:allophanate hydrolase [Roseovarius sp. HI0049]|nr:allophanate hydrolase [Roseovarius sp. HI0049]